LVDGRRTGLALLIGRRLGPGLARPWGIWRRV